ncbi:hypothetical protein PAXRUDRAFT_830431 [Paxillus rubicundulus Ve08.2h10]|uniref:Uncharacterized protein n=1 Tax=Paxillus rubicundulus Ve08.2h10 TaxID=930991 RepID=A0A0D0DTK3_9AGAM|nr:hypothetical protein PAXRUDRAFT_830431 [Paxillus rubicundulus Ve08.2h10]
MDESSTSPRRQSNLRPSYAAFCALHQCLLLRAQLNLTSPSSYYPTCLHLRLPSLNDDWMAENDRGCVFRQLSDLHSSTSTRVSSRPVLFRNSILPPHGRRIGLS